MVLCICFLQSIDSLETNCVDLEERVKQLILDDAQSDFDIPNDVASTEALLNEHAVCVIIIYIHINVFCLVVSMYIDSYCITISVVIC